MKDSDIRAQLLRSGNLKSAGTVVNKTQQKKQAKKQQQQQPQEKKNDK